MAQLGSCPTPSWRASSASPSPGGQRQQQGLHRHRRWTGTQGRTTEVRALAAEMLWVFDAQNVHLEALKALELFFAAAARDAVTVQLAHGLVDYLQRSRHDPELRFDRAAAEGGAQAGA